MKQILFADDDDSIRNLMLNLFKNHFANYEIEAFPDGTSLDSRLERNISNVCLVLTDNSMPGINGSEIIKKYAKNPSFDKISFILVYGGDEDIGNMAVKKGAFAFINKPYSIEEILSLAEKALNR